MNFLSGKIAVVTGGGSGIGRASSMAFARAGAAVMVSDVRDDAAQAVAEEILAAGGVAKAISCDVRDGDQIERLIAQTVEAFGRVDCAFNNAGYGGAVAKVADYPVNIWDDVLRTNLTSVFLCMKYQIAQMLRQGGGSIVNCASVTGLVGTTTMPAYSASKHGIVGLTRSAAIDYAEDGIRINAICPGTIHTPAVDAFLEREPDVAREFLGKKAAAHPIGRLGTPDEVAEAVLWLSSPAASFMIGHALAVDGGYTAR